MKNQNLKDKLPLINFWIHIIGGTLMIAVIAFNFIQIREIKTNIKGMVYDSLTPDNTPYMAYDAVEYTGVIKKEKIPEEYALGDYWYIFYFDKPQIIETAGGDMMRDSLQIQASTIDSLEGHLDKKVTVKGRLSYGYAESRIILVDEIIYE